MESQTIKGRDEGRRGMWTLAIIFGGLFLLFFAFASLILRSLAPEPLGKNRIGVIEIHGPILSADQIIQDLEDFVRDEEIKGILVRIDSPGGSVSASQEIYEAVKRAANKKKLVISMGNIAASGGFYIACASKPVFANAGTITGSIGVISQTFDIHKATENLGLAVNTMKSGAAKDIGNPFREMTEPERALYLQLIVGIYDQFVRAVADGRGLDYETFKRSPLVDGRVFSGADAKAAGLVDHLGGMQAAIDFLAEELKFEDRPTLIYPERANLGWLRQLVSEGAHSVRQEIGQAMAPALEFRYAGPFSQ